MSRRSVFLFPLLALLLFLAGLALLGSMAPRTAHASSHADLRILKYSSPTNEVRAGEQFTYTILVDNLGPETALNVVITDTLVTSAPVDANGCSIAVRTDGGAIDEFNCNFALSSGVFDLGTMGSNHLHPRSPTDMGRIIVTINATANQATDLTAVATVTSDSPDYNTDNNVAVTTLSITDVSDLALNKAVVGEVQLEGQPAGTYGKVAGEVTAGAALTYTVVVTNEGPSPARNVLLEDHLPGGLAVVRFSATQGSCSAGPTLICGLGTLGAGKTATVTVIAQSASSLTAGTVLSNGAIISSDVLDTDNSNNMDTVWVTVTTSSDLSIRLDQTPERVVEGDIRYTITAGNSGPSDSPFSLVTDILPDAVTSVTWQCAGLGGASCRASGSGDILETVDLPVGGSVIFVVRGTLSEPEAVVNTATIEPLSGGSDLYFANNQAQVTNAISNLYLSLLFNQGSSPAIFTEAQELWDSTSLGR